MTASELEEWLRATMVLDKAAERMKAQDNRMTSFPMPIVRERGDKGRWEHVTTCLTVKGAEEYIEANRHRLLQPEVYIASGHDNPEWRAILAVIKAAGEMDLDAFPDPGEES